MRIVVYELGETFMKGRYKVVSSTQIKRKFPTSVFVYSNEFTVEENPSPPKTRYCLEVVTDKNVYKKGENITLTVKNLTNYTVNSN